MEINHLNSKVEEEQNLVAQLQKKIKELNVSPLSYKLFSYFKKEVNLHVFFIRDF